jgi:tRNA modification GTPase
LIRGKEDRVIERAMVVFHPGPRSYTGEDVAEISCHGNPLLVNEILEAIRRTSLARIADRGEFTKRAYMNGKMDLAQAEAVGALVDAKSTAGIEMANRVLAGELSLRMKETGNDLIGILSEIEASFIIDEVEVENTSVVRALEPLICRLDALLESAQKASHLYSGIVTTIAGLPNAGKSSLFNAILGYDRAIVHQEGGTTRDILREHITVSGIDFIFHDTAGVRETSSGPEQLGIEKTIETLKRSHLVLYVVDASRGLSPEEEQWLSLGERTIVVMNKTDLLGPEIRGDTEGDAVWVSAKFKEGIGGLMDKMTSLYSRHTPHVFLERHVNLLLKAREHLANCRQAAYELMTPDALTIDLKGALRCIRGITGEDVSQDMLDDIFSKFCVGK